MNRRDAINEILLSLNELPLDVDDLIEDLPTAVIVDRELTIARKKVLSYGWSFNSLTITLVPDNEGYIRLSDQFLSVDGFDDNDIIVRDWKLFNKSTMSYKFSGGVEVDIIEDSAFDDIPFSVANLIVQTASLQAYINIVGNADDIALRKNALDLARIEAIRDDANKLDGNILTSEFAITMLARS